MREGHQLWSGTYVSPGDAWCLYKVMNLLQYSSSTEHPLRFCRIYLGLSWYSLHVCNTIKSDISLKTSYVSHRYEKVFRYELNDGNTEWTVFVFLCACLSTRWSEDEDSDLMCFGHFVLFKNEGDAYA